MAKARITITSTFEYDVIPEHYAPGASLEDCLNVDIRNAEDDPAMFLEMDGADLKVTGEIVSR